METRLDVLMRDYRARCRNALENPAPWMTQECLADGHAFLDAWEEWDKWVAKERRLMRNAFIFVICLPYYLFISKHERAASEKMHLAQEKWNQHYLRNKLERTGRA